MIRRRSKRHNGDNVDAAPANPTSASSPPPPGSVPAGGDEAPPFVIDELLAAFSVDGVSTGTGVAKAPASAPPAPKAPAPKAPAPKSPAAADDVPTQSTRAMSPTEIVGHVETVPPPAPSPDAGLVPEPTRRSERRSKREAKREAKREKKRLAKHAKAQRKEERRARKQAGKKPSRKARRQAQLEGPPASAAIGSAEAAGVRVISHEEAATAAVLPTLAGAPTIHIADDELPDPVYLEGDLGSGGSAELGGGPSRSTVFIDEDPSHVDVVTMDVATSATRIEPRMRERRIAVRRAVGRRRLKWIAIVTSVVLVIVAVLAVLGSGLFAIKDVEVEGAVYSVGPAFDAVVDELEGSNVLRVDTDKAERELEDIAWIEDARVTTDFPNGATIEVRERIPSIAYQGPDGRYRVLDRYGRVLDVIDGQPTAYLELLVTDGTDLEQGQMSPTGYQAAATLVHALPPQLRQWALSVSADADGNDLRLMLDSASVGGPSGGGPAGGIEVLFGEATDLVDKLVRLLTVLTNQDPDNLPSEEIDVSTADVVDR